MITSYAAAGVGRVVAAEGDAYFLPTLTRTPPRPPIVWCHSSGGSVHRAYENDVNDSPGQWAKIRALPDAVGCAVIATDMGGTNTTFGNDLGMSRILAAAAYLVTIGVSAPGPIIVIGSSMGSENAICFARKYTGQCLAICPLITACDAEYVRQQNADTAIRGVIDTAWAPYGGTAYPANMPLGANGYDSTFSVPQTGKLVGFNSFDPRSVPMRSYYVDNDFFTPLALEQEFVAAWGARGQRGEPGVARALGRGGGCHRPQRHGLVPVGGWRVGVKTPARG